MEGFPRYWSEWPKNFCKIIQHAQRTDIVSQAIALYDLPGGLPQLDAAVHGPAAKEAVGLLLAHAIHVHQQLFGPVDEGLVLLISPGGRPGGGYAVQQQAQRGGELRRGDGGRQLIEILPAAELQIRGFGNDQYQGQPPQVLR